MFLLLFCGSSFYIRFLAHCHKKTMRYTSFLPTFDRNIDECFQKNLFLCHLKAKLCNITLMFITLCTFIFISLLYDTIHLTFAKQCSPSFNKHSTTLKNCSFIIYEIYLFFIIFRLFFKLTNYYVL